MTIVAYPFSSLQGKFLPRGNVRGEFVSFPFIVDAAAVMLHPVAHYEPPYLHLHVVSAYLVEHRLCDGYLRCLVFHNHDGAGLCIEDNGVASFPCVVEVKGHLIGYARRIISFLLDEKVYEMLTDPFFWRKNDEFSSQNVENH